MDMDFFQELEAEQTQIKPTNKGKSLTVNLENKPKFKELVYSYGNNTVNQQQRLGILLFRLYKDLNNKDMAKMIFREFQLNLNVVLTKDEIQKLKQKNSE